jgi:Cu+-exporting ATPase
MGLFGFGKKKTGKHEHGHEHGHEHEHKHEAAGAQKVKDVVCGMMIDPATAAGKSEYQGKTYYFCALGCKKSFDADPAKYVKTA